MKKLITLIALCVLLTGCEQSYDLSKEQLTYIDAFAKSAVAFNTDKQEGNIVVPVVPAKYKRKDCPECKGSGRVRTGDGILVIDCTACEPDGTELAPKRFVDKAGKSWWGYDGKTFWSNPELTGESRTWPAPQVKTQATKTTYYSESSGSYCASCSVSSGRRR